MQQDQYLVFEISNKFYAVKLPAVERVIRAVELIYLPKAPDNLLGLINMEGAIIPVVNIRKQFNLPNQEIELDNRIIISRTSTRAIAFIVDGVEGVIEFSQSQLDRSRQMLPEMEQYIGGVGELNNNAVLIYKIDHLYPVKEINGLYREIAKQGQANLSK